MFNIVERRRWFYLLSVVVVLLGVAAMIVNTVRSGMPVRLGVGFSGGNLYELQFEDAVDASELREVFESNGLGGVIVQQLGEEQATAWQVQAREAAPAEEEALLDDLEAQFGLLDRDLFDPESVAPTLAGTVGRAALYAILGAWVIVLGYVWYSFRSVPRASSYAVAATVGVLHDTIVALGFYALMGILFGWEVDLLSLTAILSVISFSAYNTIVVFDRVRENVGRRSSEPFGRVVNRSILETLQRSLAVLMIAVFIMIAIVFVGGETLRPFVSTLLVGILSGTYSAIFVASPLLVSWERMARRRAARTTT